MRIIDKKNLDVLYQRFNRRRYVHPDPLEFLYPYRDLRDREIVGLIASSLAYGRVNQILEAVSKVLDGMNRPYHFLLSSSPESIRTAFKNFKYRFTTGDDLVNMLSGLKRIIEIYGSLYECFISGLNDKDDTVLPALSAFLCQLSGGYHCTDNSLIPRPAKGSACKRINLFLRWMVRKDLVDPGGWDNIPASKLIVPLDTHLHRICLALNLTRRKQADMKTAEEITYAFRMIAPDDPVKYDFALTRSGIWGRGSLPEKLMDGSLIKNRYPIF